MITTACVQALLTEARYLDTKPPERHDMGLFVCGTASCAAGDMMIRGDLRHDEAEGEYSATYAEIGEDLGITSKCAEYLFATAFYLRGRRVNWRDLESPAQTAARIRKFVYYKLKKRELFADYERARHQEGDWHVARSVLELVEAKA